MSFEWGDEKPKISNKTDNYYVDISTESRISLLFEDVEIKQWGNWNTISVPRNETIDFSLINDVSWISYDNLNKKLILNPTLNDKGFHSISVKLEDLDGHIT